MQTRDSDGEPEVSIVIPTYNEAENIPTLVQRISKALKDAHYEVIIVDDNSPDATPEVATCYTRQGHPIRVVVRPRRTGFGKPSAIIHGALQARGKYIAFLDADGEWPPEALPDMLNAAANGADVVIGYRTRDTRPAMRRIISTGAKLLAKLLIPELRRFKDPTTELILIRNEASLVNAITPRVKPFLNLLRFAVRRGLRIAEIEIAQTQRRAGKSSFKPRWILQYLRQLMELSDWVLPKYIAAAAVAAAIARLAYPFLGAASLALSLAIRYTALRRHITLTGLLAGEAASTILKTLLLGTLGPLSLAIAGTIETLIVTTLRK